MQEIFIIFFLSLCFTLCLSTQKPNEPNNGADYTSTWTTSELRGVSSEDSEYLRKWKENKHKEMMNKDNLNFVFPRRMKNRENNHQRGYKLSANLLREKLLNLKQKNV
uniref:Uncharacterized protein n=1 Tax=Clastoptera arizonana TaxID=38151 RepID=A0A1B6D6A6_9HEMI